MKLLSVNNIILLHEKLIKATGGSFGTRDIGLIESALNRGLMTYDKIDLYPSIIEKIAVITHSLISNHGFIDGNKRIGIAVMIMLVKINNIEIAYSQQELIDLGLKTAAGLLKEKDISNWIEKHMKD